MEVQPDFRELCELPNSHSVDYVIVGGYALAFHGAPRATGDIDILIKASPDNAERIVDALADFGFGSLDLSREDFEKPDQVIQLGVPPVRIDIITSLSAVSWEEAEAGRAPGTLGDVEVFYLGLEEFVASKRAAGRKKDLADLEALGQT